MGQDQELLELGGLLWAELKWLASERRSWDEVSDAWRANPAADVFEDVVRWTARGYARSVALCFADMDDGAQPLLRRLIQQAADGMTPSLRSLAEDAPKDLDDLARLARRVRVMADDVVAYQIDGLMARDTLFEDLNGFLDDLFALGNRYLVALGRDAVGRPSRRFYPNGIMRRPWLAPSWRPSLFPARADLERAGEFWPIIDFLSEHDHAAIVASMDKIVERLRDRSVWIRPSPIRSVLDELGLPSKDPCLQLVRDKLFEHGMDWRPTPPPIPPPID